MNLPRELISQFAKITKDEESKREKTVFGTIVEEGDSKYVQIDGSGILTPISYTVDMVDGERVTVMIKNHSAIVTGNITSPAARSEEVNKVKNTIGAYVSSEGEGSVFGKKVDDQLLYNLLVNTAAATIRKGSTNLAKFTDDLIELGNSEAVTNIYAEALYHYIKGVAYKPYFTTGDSLDVMWYGAGIVSDSAANVRFSIPLSKPVVGAPTVTVTSQNGLKVCQSSLFTHGSSSSAYATPSSYSASIANDGGSINVIASFGDVTNAEDNAPCGITASIKITFS